ncbi:hypothetical protein [Maribacter aestuarii]|uniref:hypothetical protein n=1 Tax=Maribacter aestuarii TaxID=1130723 RepID=UPI00248B4744|nr:hypothetical protein [Maribacter aestuarii]
MEYIHKMKDVVYRNYDRYAIKHLLMEIGAHAMRMECERKFLTFPKRLGLFFLEQNDFCTFLRYNYPQKGIISIMKIDRWELPEKGWERVKLQ